MRTTIDAAGRIVVPKSLREQLGFAPGAELEVEAVDGQLEVVGRRAFSSRPDATVLASSPMGRAPAGRARAVRALIERSRR